MANPYEPYDPLARDILDWVNTQAENKQPLTPGLLAKHLRSLGYQKPRDPPEPITDTVFSDALVHWSPKHRRVRRYTKG